MPLDPAVKAQMLKSTENVTKCALDEVVALGEAYALSTPGKFDDSALKAVKTLRELFLNDLVDGISP